MLFNTATIACGGQPKQCRSLNIPCHQFHTQLNTAKKREVISHRDCFIITAKMVGENRPNHACRVGKATLTSTSFGAILPPSMASFLYMCM